MSAQVQRPALWVSYWMAASAVVGSFDAVSSVLTPLIGNGSLDRLLELLRLISPGHSSPAAEGVFGTFGGQALIHIIEIVLAVQYLYLRHTSPTTAEPRTPKSSQAHHAHAPLVGFAGALVTLFRTSSSLLQDYSYNWRSAAGYNTSTSWTLWAACNGTWIILPLMVSIALGQFITNALMRDTVNQIVYLEHSSSAQSAVIASANKSGEVETRDGDGHDGEIEEEEIAVTAQSPPAALPLTFHPRGLSVLIVGSNRLVATRATAFLNADAKVIISSRSSLTEVAEEVRSLHASGRVEFTQLEAHSAQSWSDALSSRSISLVCVTDTLIGAANRRTASSAKTIYEAATSLRIPLNISDQPSLSTFTFPSVHKFLGVDGAQSNLQIAVTTNGQGCRLSGRIKREIVSRLPGNVGAAVDNVGKLRSRAKAKAHKITDEDVNDGPLNTPVPQIGTPSISRVASFDRFEAALTEEEQQLRRMRWVHQMSEYYSFEHLARLKDEDLETALELWSSSSDNGIMPHHESIIKGKGRILLIGSGPGHPGLLTCAAHHALKTATLILSDKLVPPEILALIPPSTKLHIAKKFPGNAEGAQNEMMALALAGAQAGEVVVRLKQGDPFVYGRGGEEVLFFREHGFESVVIPGISSALAAPLMMGIPVTQRGVAESLVMCTGVGRQGKAVQLPGYVKSRTLVMLMGVARINQIIEVLTSGESVGRDGAAYPRHLPIGIIERASSPDQRVILSTLGEIEESLRKVDERPPGMMIVGWAALCLEGKGRVDVLDSGVEAEQGIVDEWLGGEGYKIREGLAEEWREILTGVQ